MSEYEIPFHIQEEIMKRLPVKSLIRFRSVSKAWKSLIDSSYFIVAHSHHRHTQPQHLLVSFITPEDEKKYVSFVDDETLLQQRPVPNSPPYVKENHYAKIVGISHGLVCLYCPLSMVTVIWNPSIRKLIVFYVPRTPYPYLGQHLFVGFGVCPVTSDPKIVAVSQSWDKANIETSYRWEVMVCMLSSRKWRSLSTNLPTKPLRRWWEVVAADGFIYWLGGLRGRNMIISFDVTNESFQMIDLFTTLAHLDLWCLHIHKLRESLAILQYEGNNDYTVWKMEGGVQRSFTKLFTIQLAALEDSILGFTKSGVPILRVGIDRPIKLVVYEPNSENSNILEVSGDPSHFTVDSYTETLLLLGRSDCRLFDISV